MAWVSLHPSHMKILPTKKVPHLKLFDEEILKKTNIPILQFSEKASLPKDINFKTLEKKCLYCTTSKIQLLYGLVASRSFMKVPLKIQSWKMVLQPLPIIDLDPTNMSCILSTLPFLADLAHTYNKPSIAAFDQPFFWNIWLLTSFFLFCRSRHYSDWNNDTKIVTFHRSERNNLQRQHLLKIIASWCQRWLSVGFDYVENGNLMSLKNYA